MSRDVKIIRCSNSSINKYCCLAHNMPIHLSIISGCFQVTTAVSNHCHRPCGPQSPKCLLCGLLKYSFVTSGVCHYVCPYLSSRHGNLPQLARSYKGMQAGTETLNLRLKKSEQILIEHPHARNVSICFISINVLFLAKIPRGFLLLSFPSNG